MPAVDWTFLAQINLWQVALVIIALYILGRLLVRFWPWLKRVTALVDSLAQLPEFIVDTKATLETQSETLARIKHEVLPNTGGSLRDAVDGQGKDLAAIKEKLANDNVRIRELENTQPHPPRPRRSQPKKKE